MCYSFAEERLKQTAPFIDNRSTKESSSMESKDIKHNAPNMILPHTEIQTRDMDLNTKLSNPKKPRA